MRCVLLTSPSVWVFMLLHRVVLDVMSSFHPRFLDEPFRAVPSRDSSNMAGQEDPVQREIHQDWANREYIEVITSSIKKIADFLNSFGEL